jgi:hypothetical protein
MDKPNDHSNPFGNDKAINLKSIPADPATAGLSVVFCGDTVQVRAGFVIALQLMGMDAPPPDVSEDDPQKQGASAIHKLESVSSTGKPSNIRSSSAHHKICRREHAYGRK